jgi:hypothetical protein
MTAVRQVRNVQAPRVNRHFTHAVHPVQIVRRCSRQCAEVVLNVKKDLCTRHTR